MIENMKKKSKERDEWKVRKNWWWDRFPPFGIGLALVLAGISYYFYYK